MRTVAVMILLATLLSGCTGRDGGSNASSTKPPLTGAAAAAENDRLKKEIERLFSGGTVTVTSQSPSFEIGASVSVQVQSTPSPPERIDQLVDKALRLAWNTRQFVPDTVNIVVVAPGTKRPLSDLTRLGFFLSEAASSKELRGRYGAPAFEQ